VESRLDESMHTLLCGLDSACLPVLSRRFRSGDLPTLQSIVDDGAAGPLESQIPPWTPSAWPSLYTGTNPGKHGVFDFLAFEGYDWEVVNATHVRERPLWELLSDLGYTSVVVNVPVTHPVEPFDGALVPGYTAPEHPTSHPEGTLEAVRDAIGDYRVYPREPSAFADPLDRYREVVRMRGEAFRYLADEYDPEFGFVEFQQTDTVFHDRPGDREAATAVYAAVDEQVRAILSACDPDVVVLASDHGMGRYDAYEVRVNEHLREEGYLTGRRGGEGMPVWSTVLNEHLKAGRSDTTYEQTALDRAVATLARAGITTRHVAAALEAVGLRSVVGRHLPAGLVEAGSEQVDFPRSVAYMRSRSELGVRINLAGREPDGVVPAGEYEAVRSELIEALRGVRTPDGVPVFEDVAPREAYFEGPEVERAVDVVTVPAGFEQFVSARLGGGVFVDPTQPWGHKREGVVALAGAGIDADASLEGAHLFDVAPTVLATMGVPRDVRMDGEVLPAVDDAGERAYPEYDPATVHATDDEEVERRLADLGYLDR
jgi:predicted AlkP superfamily phosphohydrolase/phosphomutase